MKLHHLGYAVRDIEQSKLVFEALGYSASGEVFHDVSRNCNILFMSTATDRQTDRQTDLKDYVNLIELIATLNADLPSPVAGMLKKSPSVLYHPCFITEDIATEIVNLTGKGYRLLRDTAPAPAIGATAKVAFLYDAGIGVIEIVEL
jgi:methylmalonyl-CoA/ethylmalonyl-CoA epimerase